MSVIPAPGEHLGPRRSFAQAMPAAPASICQRATTGDLCVFGVRPQPRARLRRPAPATRAMFVQRTRMVDQHLRRRQVGEIHADQFMRRAPDTSTGSTRIQERWCARRRGRDGRVTTFAEDVAEVRRDGEVAAVVALVGREPRPLAVDAAARGRRRRSPSSRWPWPWSVPRLPFSFTALPNSDNRQHHGVGHAIAEVGDQRGRSRREKSSSRVASWPWAAPWLTCVSQPPTSGERDPRGRHSISSAARSAGATGRNGLRG